MWDDPTQIEGEISMADPFMSEVRMFGLSFAPKGWALCNGQLLPIAQNQALMELGNPGSVQLGAFGKGSGKWRLTIESDVDVEAQALLDTPNGFITNTSAPVR